MMPLRNRRIVKIVKIVRIVRIVINVVEENSYYSSVLFYG